MSAAAASLSGLALSRSVLDRLAHRRVDPGLLAGLLADPATRVVALRGDRMALREDGDALVVRPAEPADALRLAFFLGIDPGDGAAYVGVVEDDDPGPDWRTLRQVGAVLPDLDAGVFTATLALANWHRTHGFCSRCGAPSEAALGGWSRRCSACAAEHFPRTDPAVIVSVVDDDGRLLLGRGLTWPQNQYSVLAGFVEPGESFEAAVVREVLEESGVLVDQVRYLGNQPWPFPASIMVGASAHAVTTEAVADPQELAEVRWVTREEYAALLRSAAIRVPGGISIAKRLVELWLGTTLEQAAGGRVIEGFRPSR